MTKFGDVKMKNFEEWVSNFKNIDLEKEIREKRLLSEDEAANFTFGSKIYPEFMRLNQLYFEAFGDDDNPFKLNVLTVAYEGVYYLIKESLEEEIEIMSDKLTFLNEMFGESNDLMKLCFA